MTLRTLTMCLLIALIGSMSALQHMADHRDALNMVAMAPMAEAHGEHEHARDTASLACLTLCVGSSHNLVLPLFASDMTYRRSTPSLIGEAVPATRNTLPSERPPKAV